MMWDFVPVEVSLLGVPIIEVKIKKGRTVVYLRENVSVEENPAIEHA